MSRSGLLGKLGSVVSCGSDGEVEKSKAPQSPFRRSDALAGSRTSATPVPAADRHEHARRRSARLRAKAVTPAGDRETRFGVVVQIRTPTVSTTRSSSAVFGLKIKLSEQPLTGKDV